MHWKNMTLSTVVIVWENLEMTDGMLFFFVYKPMENVLFAHRQRQWHGSLPPLW